MSLPTFEPPAPPDQAQYPVIALAVVTFFASPEDYTQHTGLPCPAFDPDRDVQYWVDLYAAEYLKTKKYAGPGKITANGRFITYVQTATQEEITLPVTEAASPNIPTGRNMGIVSGAPYPRRELLSFERLTKTTPYQQQPLVQRTDLFVSPEPPPTPADPVLLDIQAKVTALCGKFGVQV